MPNQESDFSKLNLIKLLREFTQNEINEFDKFVKSPFFNNQSTLIRLYDELKKYYPDFNDKNLSKEKLFEKVNPELEYNDVQFRKYFSNLFKLAEEYLICVECNINKERKKVHLINQFEKRNLNEFYDKGLKEIDRIENEKNHVSNEYFITKYFTEETKFIHFIKINELDKISFNMRNSHNNIILQLLLITAVYNNILLVNKKIYRDSEVEYYFEEFLLNFDFEKFYSKFDDLSEDIKNFIELCRYDIKLSKNPLDETDLLKMKELVFKLSDFFNDNLNYTFITHLNIYYNINVQNGFTKFEREIFENNNYMIQNEFYNYEGNKFINYSEFRSMLVTALNLKEFVWSEKFIDEFGVCFPKEQKDSYVSYSKALLLFELKQFEKSLKYLSHLKLGEIFMKLDVNIVLAMIYYELGYEDSAKSLIVTFKIYLKTNQAISKEVADNHLNFLGYYKKILKIKKSELIKLEVSDLKSEIENNNSVRRRLWLLEKLSELERKII